MSEFQIFDAMKVDARERTLHLLPVLQIDPFGEDVRLEDVSLHVSTSWLDTPVLPVCGEWTIHHPYPNKLYYVGGSNDCHLGHFIPLPAEQQTGEVTFTWTIAASATEPSPDRFQVTHRLDLTFGEGEGQTYSMDIANWWSRSEFANEEHSQPEIGRNRFSRLKHLGISPTRRAHIDETIRDGCRYLSIHESQTLPAITLNDCWTVKAFGGDAALNYLETLGKSSLEDQ